MEKSAIAMWVGLFTIIISKGKNEISFEHWMPWHNLQEEIKFYIVKMPALFMNHRAL